VTEGGEVLIKSELEREVFTTKRGVRDKRGSLTGVTHEKSFKLGEEKMERVYV